MLACRIGKQPVTIPSGVDVKVLEKEIAIKGPKGHVSLPLHPYVKIDVEGNVLKVQLNPNAGYCRTGSGSKMYNAITGTVRAKIYNMVVGVTKGFEKKLVLVGVGYRAQMKGKMLSLAIGFSHPVEIATPEGVTIETPSQTEIVIKGANKQLVGHIAATIRDVRPPEPYKGKGIRYSDENVVIKETKKK